MEEVFHGEIICCVHYYVLYIDVLHILEVELKIFIFLVRFMTLLKVKN